MNKNEDSLKIIDKLMSGPEGSSSDKVSAIERIFNNGQPMTQWQKRFTFMGVLVAFVAIFFIMDNSVQQEVREIKNKAAQQQPAAAQ